MSASGSDDWATGIETMLMNDDKPSEQYLFFVSDKVPEYMYEHRQNRYEAELMYSERVTEVEEI